MLIKVAEIPYLNCLPFYWDKTVGGPSALQIKWIKTSPKKLGELALQGKIDAGPVSLADSFALEERFEPLSDLCIAVKNAAKSVLLFSKKPFRSLAGCRIGLTPDTATSSELLKFILEGQYGIEVKYHSGFNRSDGAQLRIGDAALKEMSRGPSKRFQYVTDLGEEWHRWQKLPFVFARWMVKKEMDPAAKSGLLKMIRRNLSLSSRELSGAIQRFESAAQWRYPQAGEYLQGFRYQMGPQEEKAVAVFKRLTKGFAATVCGC